jgi:hypothetical protein
VNDVLVVVDAIDDDEIVDEDEGGIVRLDNGIDRGLLQTSF